MRYKSKLISHQARCMSLALFYRPTWTLLSKCNQCDYASSYKSTLRRHLKTHSGEKAKLSHQAGCMSFLLSNLDSVGQGASLPFFSCPTHLTKVHVFLPLFPCTLHYICLHCICQHITAAYITHAYITPTPITSAYITSSYILSAFMYTPAYTYNVVQALSLSR